MTLDWAGPANFLAYGLAAIACALAALWVLRKGDHQRSDRAAGFAALGLSTIWCVTATSAPPDAAIVALTEIARTVAWLFVLYRLFGNDGRDASVQLVRPVVVVLILVELAQFALLLATTAPGTPGDGRAIFEIGALLHMLVTMGALVLLHNLYGGAEPGSWQLLKWPTAALAALFAFDLNFYTVAYIVDTLPPELVVLRAVATMLAAAPFALGFNRHSAELEFSPSRAVTFRFLSLAAIAVYLAVMLGIAQWLNMLDGSMARLTQVGMIIAAGALSLIWLPSEKVRGWLRVTAVKHLFKHRYDYRNEWIRFTNTIGRTGFDESSLEARCIKALADITGSEAGLLLLPDDDGALIISERWQWPLLDAPLRAFPPELATILEREMLILDFDEVRAGKDYYGEVALVPAWLREESRAWAAVPLLHFDRLVGVVVLTRPLIARKLDWEDFDLLGVVGRQLASYLAEEAGQAALLEAGRFDEFNRRIAFVLHDIKNLSSQMSLLLRNAEKHADKPEFRTDMLVTLRNSADKLNALLARLGRYGAQGGERHETFDLASVAKTLAERHAHTHPVLVLRADPAPVTGDREAFEQAAAHLIQNAIDASEPGSPVSLEVRSNGPMALFEVIDAGGGMSPQFLRAKLFKPFVSSKEGGFGIGAYEARELVRAMGGRIEVESREGYGSRFTVSLPLKTARLLGGIAPFALSETAL